MPLLCVVITLGQDVALSHDNSACSLLLEDNSAFLVPAKVSVVLSFPLGVHTSVCQVRKCARMLRLEVTPPCVTTVPLTDSIFIVLSDTCCWYSMRRLLQ